MAETDFPSLTHSQDQHTHAAPSADSQAPNRRTRNRNARRDRIFRAAITLFMQRGFEETTMDDIATQAGLGRTTVFNHFPRKTQFLEEWSLRRRQRAQRAFADAARRARSLRVLLGRYFDELAQLNEETRAETTVIMPAAVRHTAVLIDHPLVHDLAEIIADASTELRPGTAPELVGRLLALGYFSTVCRWIETDPPPFNLGDEFATLLEAVLDGALARPRRG